MSRTLLAATTSAVASAPYTCAGPSRLPAHFTCPGIAGAEVATLQKYSAALDTWYDYYVDGTLQQITATNTGVVAFAPGEYRVNKGATAAAVPVELSMEESP